jgi:hypothetical protein
MSMTSRVIERKQPYHYCAGKPYQGERYGLAYLRAGNLVLFSLYTGWTMLIAEQSLLAFGLAQLSRPDTAQVVIDLYLIAGLACLWMVKDNRLRAVPASWCCLTCC